MNVRVWLRGLGLGRYEEKFRESKIDFDVLADVTDGDLRELGVPLGDRRRLLRAIAELGLPKSSATQGRRARAAPTRSLAQLNSAERRPITVMFCDLVGSTQLAAALDVEDWRNLIGAHLDEASKAVTRLGGHVVKRLGDGLMAVFGYPRAQENDAERAVLAALAIQQALAELNTGNARSGAPQLAVRIGLEGGPVVVDDDGDVFGEAPNIAARVQAAAEPGTVLVTSTVQRQVAGLFIVEDKGAYELKGALAPMNLYRIQRISGGRRRRASQLLTTFVGREKELEALARSSERALAGHGQFVLVSGEPGIGKSRLVEEFRGRLADKPHSWVEWSSSQLLQNTPFHPLLGWGRVRFGGSDVPAERRLAELEALLADLKLDAAKLAPLLAPIVGIPISPKLLSNVSAESIRRRQKAGMVEWAIAGSRNQPLVLVVEDLQWFDPTSVDLVQALIEAAVRAPILIIATARPEFIPSWNAGPHHDFISLASLDDAQMQRMIAEVAARRALSTEVVRRVSDRAGGVPLFIEEVTQLVLERGERRATQAIPPTLRQSLAARLDRLGPAREVAQIGSVLGRSFSYGLLREVASPAGPSGHGLDEASLQAALTRLVNSTLLFVEGVPPEASYSFKHALVQDAAYDGLLRNRRQTLHRHAAAALIAAQSEPEAIARHLTAAGAKSLAVRWWAEAGEDALRRAAFKEAMAHLGKAIALDEEVQREEPQHEPEDPAVSERRMRLHTDYGHAAMWLKGFAADEMSEAYARASRFAGPTDETAPRFVAYYGECLTSFMRGEIRQAQAEAEVFLREAEAERRPVEAGVARRVLGFVSLLLGDLQASRKALKRTLRDYVAKRDREGLFRFGNDTRVSATNFLSLTEWHLGEVERARELSREANRRATDLAHAASIASTLFFRTALESRRGDVPATRAAVESLLAVTQEHDLKTYTDLGRIYANWVRGKEGEAEAGAAGLREALDSYLALGNRSGAPSFYGLLAELEAMRPNVEGALAAVDAGLSIAEATGEHYTNPYLYRLRGEFLLMRSPGASVAAEKAFQTAIAIADAQGARSFALSASCSIAKLYQSTGRPDEAQAILAPALQGFSPTSDMPEIAEARTLFGRLSVTPRR
ncbi:MAG TPA: adenylate/guanylate cyclase domain-containing protein [Roseiarcus sp.]|nr:adenylate/guanylate cyclase domain-containing protein [Roseiarcus sp.]